MLTALLVLAATAFAAQDAPEQLPPSPQDAAPAPADAPADASAARTEETSPEVRSFLTDAEKLLYDPQAAGLKSVEFDTTVIYPKVGSVGSIHMVWSSGTDATVAFERNEQAQLPPGIPPEVLPMIGEQFGREFLNQMLNRPITPLMADSHAKMEAPQDGLLCISVDREAERAQRIKEHFLYFDEDGLLMKSRIVRDMEGSGAPFSTLPITETYAWKASAPGSELLVLEARAGEQDFGMLGKEKTTTTYTYTTVDGLVLLTGMHVDSQLPAMLGGPDERQYTLRNLVVNGKPAEVASPPTPPSPPEEPAAPVTDPPAGG
jgi:hypothetical protein